MDRIASNYTHRPIENQGTAVAESGVNCPVSPIDVNRDEKQSEEKLNDTKQWRVETWAIFGGLLVPAAARLLLVRHTNRFFLGVLCIR
jgi:hypothetical protein